MTLRDLLTDINIMIYVAYMSYKIYTYKKCATFVILHHLYDLLIPTDLHDLHDRGR